jgi:hypothetical protein
VQLSCCAARFVFRTNMKVISRILNGKQALFATI